MAKAVLRYDQARAALQAATKVDDVKKIRDKAEALRIYARQQKDTEMEAWTAAIKVRANHRIGELSRELPKVVTAGPSRVRVPKSGKPKEQVLKEAGISKSVADRCEKMAEIPKEEFEAFIEEKVAKGQAVTANEVYKAVTSKRKKERRQKERAARPPNEGDSIRLCRGSCNAALKEPHGTVDWVITDPPYEKKHLGLYDLLAEIAEHVLKPGGSLLCMTGQSHLPAVISSLTERLTYQWTLAYLTPGGQAVQVFDRKVNTFWKPVLWFVKGQYDGDWIGDVTRSKPNDNDKDFHDWGQSETGMNDLMSRFVNRGDLVFDPFMGGGTTGIVALERGARFWGYEIDPKVFEATMERMGVRP